MVPTRYSFPSVSPVSSVGYGQKHDAAKAFIVVVERPSIRGLLQRHVLAIYGSDAVGQLPYFQEVCCRRLPVLRPRGAQVERGEAPVDRLAHLVHDPCRRARGDAVRFRDGLNCASNC